ncbi:MAG TPA: EamA family transporter [Catenuloplanes sp.]|jgi:drug/metabolite transporter (DMT)-like permease
MSRRGWVLFLAMSLIWGIPYLLIKIAVAELSPATLVLARTAIAAVLLTPVALARGQLGPLVRHWRPLLAYTVVELCIPWYLLAVAEQTLSSSLTGLLLATVPLVSAVLVVVTGHERLGPRRVLGLLVGFAGVGLLVGLDIGTGNLTAVAALAVVAVCYAAGPFILARRLSGEPELAVVAGSLLISTVAYLPFGIAQAPATVPSIDTVLAVLALGLVCTAAAFLLFFKLIAEVGPARATVITYVNPAVALALGVAVLDEPFTLAMAVGFGLILTGSVLGTGRDRSRVPAPAEP